MMMTKLYHMAVFVLLLSLKLSSGFDLAGLMRTGPKIEDTTVDTPIIPEIAADVIIPEIVADVIIPEIVADVIPSEEIETGQ